MYRIFKTISLFLLVIAGLTVIAHSIIPHDHHLADAYSGNGDSCPVSDNRPGHHPGLPVHCHAFNDLTSEKIVLNIVPDEIQLRNLGVINDCNHYFADLQSYTIKYYNVRILLPDMYGKEYSSLRAPPSKG